MPRSVLDGAMAVGALEGSGLAAVGVCGTGRGRAARGSVLRDSGQVRLSSYDGAGRASGQSGTKFCLNWAPSALAIKRPNHNGKITKSKILARPLDEVV